MSSNGFDPFAAHGLDHLSPSACAEWVASPGTFLLQRIFKRPRHVGAAAHRGSAVEAGVSRGLDIGLVLDACVEHALAEFDRLQALSGDARKDTERAAIPGMVKQGLLELVDYGRPVAMQGKVEMSFDGLAVPLWGFYDFMWSDHGVLVDLKTLHALPSSIRSQHSRQCAFYCAAGAGLGNMSPRITYVTSKKSVTYGVDEPARHVEALGRIALSIQKFLALSRDPMELAALIAPDFDSFYWSDVTTRQQGYEIWRY